MRTILEQLRAVRAPIRRDPGRPLPPGRILRGV